ncbi:hypothetical protein T265_06008 [Opisthorchis viverrini]|uniref:Uncharacterized protein n=1 Tax=Opisthorchis viverrini TaxID=6198 RepID=A0A075AEJ9_OPIVI|nr:hypothetical protein T265_06008 [Opisthorchis viverrini]KER26794.1 hypothetical protein T265_06008 [Opisthorchis viverrini]
MATQMCCTIKMKVVTRNTNLQTLTVFDKRAPAAFVVHPNAQYAVKDENDTPTNVSTKATSEAIADEVQSRICTNNFQMTSIETNRKK